MKNFAISFLIFISFLMISNIAAGTIQLPDTSQTKSDGILTPTDKHTTIPEPRKQEIQSAYGKLPLSFIQNDGQIDKKVKFYERGSGHSTYFTEEGVYLNLVRSQKTEVTNHKKDKFSADKKTLESEIVKLIPIGANLSPKIVAEEPQEGKVNYFTGNDPEKWKTNIPTYRAVVYKDLYNGIDMKFYGNNRQFEYDIIVKPGADPSQVRLAYEGINGLKVTEAGDLEITLHSPSPLEGRGQG